MKSRFIAMILAAILVLALFSGCSNTSAPAVDTPAPSTEQPAETPSVPENEDSEATEEPEEPSTISTFDYKAAFEAYSPDAVVLTVNGDEINWKEYYGWLYSMMEQYEMYLGTFFEWSDAFSETHSFDEYARFYAETMCSQYAVVNAESEAQSLELNEEELAYIEALFENDALTYAGGDPEAFREFLESTYMDEEYYRYINTMSIFYNKLFDNAYGVDGENLSDEEVMDFIDANGYLYAKHILFMTVDGEGNPLDEAAKAEKLAQAEDVIAQLKACKDQDELLAKFDELMNAHSEDTGLTAYPDGYYFLPGEMVTEFEEGTKALDYYAFSDIVESTYGYHIILRMPITPDSEYQAGTTFRFIAASSAFDTDMTKKFQDVEIVYSDEFADFTLESIMNKIEIEVDG